MIQIELPRVRTFINYWAHVGTLLIDNILRYGVRLITYSTNNYEIKHHKLLLNNLITSYS